MKENMKLTKQATSLLNITLEECAEVVQSISKIFRFGMDGTHPDRPLETNKMHLEEEIGDLLCMIQLLESQGLLDAAVVEVAMHKKLDKLKFWSPEVFDNLTESDNKHTRKRRMFSPKVARNIFPPP